MLSKLRTDIQPPRRSAPADLERRSTSGSELDSSKVLDGYSLLPLGPGRAVRLCMRDPGHVAHDWVRRVTEASSDMPVTVAFMNMRNYMMASRSSDAPLAFSAIDQVCPDGVGLQIARLVAGLPRFKRVSGTDTVPLLLSELPVGTRVYLVGGPEAALPRLRRAFQSLFPQVELAGLHNGYFTLEEEPALAAEIAAARADIVLVGMGSPRQELWVQRNRNQVSARLIVCVGGLFQYWTGDLSRAPRLARALGLEWLCILVQQPYKWRIYTVDAVRFFARIARLSRTSQK